MSSGGREVSRSQSAESRTVVCEEKLEHISRAIEMGPGIVGLDEPVGMYGLSA